MRSISLFAEDFGHERVVGTLVNRLAAEFNVAVEVRTVSARGGFGAVQKELKEFALDLLRFVKPLPDLVVVATDSNCRGIEGRLREIAQSVSQIHDRVVYAIPDPHIERWLLLDAAAFRAVLGEACETPDQKCSRGRYKQMLIEEVVRAGHTPLLGGMEYADEIVNAMHLSFRQPRNEFERFVSEIRAHLRRWARE